MAKYRLKASFHTQRIWVPATKEQIVDEEVLTVVRRGKHFVMDKVQYKQGNIIESDEDLVNKLGPEKFELVTANSVMTNPWDNITSLSKDQMLALAVVHEYDLGDTKNMSDKEVRQALLIAAGVISAPPETEDIEEEEEEEKPKEKPKAENPLKPDPEKSRTTKRPSVPPKKSE